MAKPELLNSLQVLSGRIDKLLDKQNELQEVIDKLEAVNKELKKQHEADLLSLENAKKEIEFLSLSHRLASTPEALISARNNISRLIRTIDNCIRMINEDLE